MFPKKRKQKEHHLAPSKASRMDNSPTSPTSPSYTNYTFGDELNIPSPPSSQSSKTPLKNYEQDWRDIEDIINRPSSPPSSPTIPLDVLTPILRDLDPTGRLSSRSPKTPIKSYDQDWTNLEDIINRPSSPPSSPTIPLDVLTPILKDLDPTGRLSSRSPKTPIKSYNQDWTDLEDIMNRPSSPPSSPTIPLDVLTPILKDLDPLNNQSPPNLSPINNQLHLSLNEYNSVFTPSPPHLSPPYPSYHPYPLYPLYPPSTPSTPSTPYPPYPPSTPSPLPDSESEDQDEDISMTSDDIFQIMMYLSDCKRDIIPIDRNHPLLNKILTEVLENQILAFNVTINNIISAKSNRDGLLDENTRKKQHAGNVNSLRLNLNRIYNNIKHKHDKIYPAAQILELINPEDPNIIFMNILEHEVDLKQELLKLKNQLESHKRRLIITPTYQNIRRHKLRPLIQILRAKFIGLYKL